jgi:hypothetical protein
MKKLKFALFLAVIALGTQPCWSQDYPYLETDYAEDQNFNYFINHKITMPGVWGLGGEAQYMLKHLVYAEAKAGYGWVIGDNSTASDSFKKFRGWYSIKAGYPILNFTAKKRGKWVVGQSSTHDYYYKIDVPAYFSLIALAGFTSEPTSMKANAVERYSFQAPVYTVGLKWMSYLNAQVKAKDEIGFVERRFEFYAGMIIPAKDEILSPENVGIATKTDRLGFEFLLSFPYRLNGWATFEIGMRSLGYNDEGQIYIGNTFYLR